MPFYRFHIDTRSRPDVVADRLQSKTRKPLDFVQEFRAAFGSRTNAGSDHFFEGSVERGGFRLRRVIAYRNSFLPQIAGKITPVSMGSRVIVTMYIHPLAAAFMSFWLFFTGSAAWNALTHSKSQDPADHYVLLGMFAFGVLLTVIGFVPEAIKAKRLLLQVLDQRGK